jgi:membrane protein YqaA with SNARE-associated domain
LAGLSVSVLTWTELLPALGTLESMNQSVPLWAMTIAPVATLLGTMLVVMLGVYLQNRSYERVSDKLGVQIEALRGEMKQHLAELELRLTKQIMDLAHWIERLEETRGLIRTP